MGPAIGSGKARYTRGSNVLDVRSYGASPKADGKTNRYAIQQALDLASKSQGRNRIGVYIPSGSYLIDKSLFVTGKELDVFGDGPGASTIVGNTSILHVGIKKSVISPTQNVLVDAYGRLDSTVAPRAGVRYGLDLQQYRMCDQSGPMFRNGDLLWSSMRQFTIDIVFDVTGFTDSFSSWSRAGICGWENELSQVPGEPWFIEVQRSANQYRVNFWLSLEKNAPRESTTYMVSTDWVGNPLIRFTAQVDLDGHNGGNGPVVVMFLNEAQVEPVLSQGASLPPVGGRLLNNYLRMFSVGQTRVEAAAPSKVFGLRVQSGLRYQYKPSGFPPAYISGGPINDYNRYFVPGPEVLFLIPFLETPSDVADHPSMRVIRATALESVPLSSKDPANSENNAFGLVATTISNLCLASTRVGAGMHMNGSTNNQFFNLRIQGVSTAISMFGNNNYANYYKNLDLNAEMAMLAMRNSGLQGFSDINTRSSAPRVFIAADMSSGASFENWLMSPSDLTQYYVYSEGASFQFKNVAADNEGCNLAGSCEFYFESIGSMDGAVVEFEWTGAGSGSYRRPSIVLAGPSSRNVTQDREPPAFFSFKSLSLTSDRSQPAQIRVDSPCWHGRLRQDMVYERGPFVLDNTPNGDSRVKVDDYWMNGPPRSSYWSKGMTKLHPPDIVSGRPLEYVCSATGGYGTANPPRWYASKVCDDDSSRLGADLVGHSYWSAGSQPDVTIFGYWSDAVQVQNMDWIFRQVAPTIPALPKSLSAGLSRESALRSRCVQEIPQGLGYSRQPVVFTFSQPGHAEASALSFGPATGNWDSGGASSLVSAVVILDASGNLIASADFTPVSVKTGGGLSFTAGSVFMEHRPISGSSFSPMVEDALTKAWLGGTALPTWNLYLALSTGHADVSAGPVEPVDPVYGRLEAPPGAWTSATGNGGGGGVRSFPMAQNHVMRYEVGVVTNKQSLNFAVPTRDWGTVRSVYLMDAATGGNVVAAADLTLPRLARAGDVALGFEIGAFRIVRS